MRSANAYGIALFTLLIVAITFASTQRGPLLSTAHAQVKAKPGAPAKPTPAAPEPRSEDLRALQSLFESFTKAFEAGDAKAFAANWTADGEYENDAGVNVHGREAIEASFAEFFAKAPDAKAEVHRESMRFLSADVAVAEGKVAVRRGPAEPAKSAQYSALFVREGGAWHIAQLRETNLVGATIDDLGWLVAEWKSLNGEGAEIRTTYTWEGNKKFIQGRFSIQEKTLAFAGIQMIGVDPEIAEVHSWTFEANGGVGEADWEHDGDNWVLDVVGTLPDGRTLTETNVLRRINDDTFTWQSVDRTLDDLEVPDLAPVKVTRVKP
ncbi:MAG TPA: SgcJ/EcaC family oxidoreductase [Pirellulales bacterium]|jgi:uncharacterized protein (TIGR02246 family)